MNAHLPTEQPTPMTTTPKTTSTDAKLEQLAERVASTIHHRFDHAGLARIQTEKLILTAIRQVEQSKDAQLAEKEKEIEKLKEHIRSEACKRICDNIERICMECGQNTTSDGCPYCLKQQLQSRDAELAAMREALGKAVKAYDDGEFCCDFLGTGMDERPYRKRIECGVINPAKAALSTTSGKALLERLEKSEARVKELEALLK